MSSQTQDTHDVQTILDQLSGTAASLEIDDLSGLAKVHGWCETVARETNPDADCPNPGISQRAATVANDLAALILGEVEDATAAFVAIIDQLEQLGSAETFAEDLLDPQCSDEECGDDSDELTDQALREKLDKVFEDEDDQAATPAEPPVEASPEAQVPADRPAKSDSPAVPPAADGEPPYKSEPLLINDAEIDFVKGFLEEAAEHLESIEAALLEVEQAPADTERINDLFRPFHTIKGMAGFLNLRDINCLTHEAETLLDQGRKGTRPVTPGLIDLIFDVVDVLKAQIQPINSYATAPTGGPVPQPPVAGMIQKLRDVVARRIEPDAADISAGSPDQKVGENLVAQGAVTNNILEVALEMQQQTPDKKVGEILVDMGAATPKQVSKAIRPQTQGQAESDGATPASGKSAGDQSIRIDTAKLDALIDMVGEMMIAQTQVQANKQIANSPKLLKDVDQVSKIVREVQEVAMAMRMVPIGPTFQKMARLLRDVSRKAGKQINLTISGEDTELDKNVIQAIGDPLVHMIRNAADHGIESPEQRRAIGKPETGEVRLHAGHQGGNILIEITDDGKGLDPEALIAKGIEKGLVQPGEELTEQQAYQLIMAPGFSTAARITDISGRGVGMDVVRRNVEQLRGKIEISSRKGQGSTFSIKLPLTLAIIDGIIVRVADERFIIPTISIEQSIRPRREQITTIQHKGEVLNVRGRLIPLIQLGQLFGMAGRLDPCEAMVVIAQCEGRSIGLVVDELLDQQQVVIKTLGEKFENLLGIPGGAILGDGHVGLILEMSGIAELNERKRIESTDDRKNESGETDPSDETRDNLVESGQLTVAEPANT